MRATRKLFSLHKTYKPKHTQLFINNQWVDSSDKGYFETVNPYTEKVLGKVQRATAHDVDKAVAASRRAFESWSQTSGYERGRCLSRLADLMEKHQEELATIESLDNGKPISDSRNIDLPLAIQAIRYYAGWADKIHGATLPLPLPYFAYTLLEPVGVCAQIYAWNFPLLLACWKLGPAMATGCTSILKPAEQTPLSILRLADLIQEAGFPPGVIQILNGEGEVGQLLAKHPDVDKLSFTGSTEVGRKLLAGNGTPNIKRMTMELGGKSANIIMDDADLDIAVSQAQTGVFFNQGQCCIAGSRVFVHSKIYDRFVEASARETRARQLGDPLLDSTTQGPQVSHQQHKTVTSFIEKGKKEGAKLAVGGKVEKHDQGYFVEPTVFYDVQDHMTIAKEEIFGPVMSVLKFDDLEEVIYRANKSHYGLGAGVVTKSLQNAQRLAAGLRAGTIYVNCYDVILNNTPFGGFKDSGLGRELGEPGLMPYLEHKTVIMPK